MFELFIQCGSFPFNMKGFFDLKLEIQLLSTIWHIVKNSVPKSVT